MHVCRTRGWGCLEGEVGDGLSDLWWDGVSARVVVVCSVYAVMATMPVVA